MARDAAAWRALWAELRQGASADLLPEEPPAIDFGREMAVVVAMPTQSCVSRVTVQSVVQEGDGAVVNLLEAPSAPNCRCMVASRPLHAVRLPAWRAPSGSSPSPDRPPAATPVRDPMTG